MTSSSSSITDWFDSLGGSEAQHLSQSAPRTVIKRKQSDPMQRATLYSASASPPRSALVAAASHQTKRVNSEMRDLYAKRKLNASAVLRTAKCTVGEYLLEKWIVSQKLPGAAAADRV